MQVGVLKAKVGSPLELYSSFKFLTPVSPKNRFCDLWQRTVAMLQRLSIRPAAVPGAGILELQNGRAGRHTVERQGSPGRSMNPRWVEAGNERAFITVPASSYKKGPAELHRGRARGEQRSQGLRRHQGEGVEPKGPGTQ